MNNKYLSKKDIYSDFFNSNITNNIFEKQKKIFEKVCIETEVDKVCKCYSYHTKKPHEQSHEQLSQRI